MIAQVSLPAWRSILNKPNFCLKDFSNWQKLPKAKEKVFQIQTNKLNNLSRPPETGAFIFEDTMPKSKRPRRSYSGKWKNKLLFVRRDVLDEIQALFKDIQLIVEITLPAGKCDINDVQKMRDMLNFGTFMMYAGHVFDQESFEREHGADWRNFQQSFHSFYGRALEQKIYVATGDELKAFWKGFEICGLIVHDELEAEPKWCLKCFFFMKKITDAPAGRISVDLTGIEQKIRGFKANIKEM